MAICFIPVIMLKFLANKGLEGVLHWKPNKPSYSAALAGICGSEADSHLKVNTMNVQIVH